MTADRDRLLQRARGIRLAVFDCDGTLTDGHLWLGDDGHEYKAFHVHDGFGMKALQDAGIEVAVISARSSAAVRRRMDELGVRHLAEGVKDKSATLDGLQKRLAIGDDATAVVGDDLTDRPLMARAALAVVVRDGARELDDVAHLRTTRAAGNGAVREVCDLLLAARSDN